MRCIFLVFGLLASSCAVGGSLVPGDIAEFIERRDRCDHFRGEEAYDNERAEFLANAIRRDCTGTDAELVALIAKYQNNPEIMSKLSSYEPDIER